METLLKIIPYKKPFFALIDQLSTLSLQQDRFTEEPSKLFIFFEFLRPGRHVFCVKSQPILDHESGQMKKTKFFAHKMLCNFREETIP
jgi:hypothetical protein